MFVLEPAGSTLEERVAGGEHEKIFEWHFCICHCIFGIVSRCTFLSESLSFVKTRYFWPIKMDYYKNHSLWRALRWIIAVQNSFSAETLHTTPFLWLSTCHSGRRLQIPRGLHSLVTTAIHGIPFLTRSAYFGECCYSTQCVWWFFRVFVCVHEWAFGMNLQQLLGPIRLYGCLFRWLCKLVVCFAGHITCYARRSLMWTCIFVFVPFFRCPPHFVAAH